MPSRSQHRRKTTSGAPAPADLLEGEIVLNLIDKRAYSKDAAGNVFEIGPPAPGSGVMVPVTVNVPYSSLDEATVTVAVPGMSAASRVMCNLAGTTEDDENELDDLSDLRVRANPKAGALEFLFTCPGAFGGPVKILYLVGA